MATAQTESIPELVDGDRMTADEFERRYHASSHIKKAELIDGVVYVASPVSTEHASPHAIVPQWLGYYQLATPFLHCYIDGTIRLDNQNQPQPDVFLLIDPDRGGRTTISDDHYVEGAPELVIEISVSSKAFDLKEKLEVYRKSGAREYIVWRVLDKAIDWFVLREGRYERLAVDADGLFKSRIFPGLWLNPEAIIRGDRLAVNRAVQLGMATPEHHDFVDRLERAFPSP